MKNSRKGFYSCFLGLNVLITLLLTSCKETVKVARSNTFFGGEIVNPITDYVVVDFVDSKSDTLFLDNNNRFSKTYKNPIPEVYKLKHHPEYQMFLLEPGDSIMVRLNTLEFDESLVFSGIGAKKNNFLIDMFLENEKDRTFLATQYSLEPNAFLNILNELIKKRLKRFKKLQNKSNLSSIATQVCKDVFMYHYHAQKEQYFAANFKHKLEPANEKHHALPKELLEHRDQININNPASANLYDYTLFLNIYVNNLALTASSRNQHKPVREPAAILKKFALIDSLFKDQTLKNIQIHSSAIEYLYFNKNVKKKSLDQILQSYKKISTSDWGVNDLMERIRSSYKLKVGDQIPDQELIGYAGVQVKMKTLLRKKLTVFYFWTNAEFSVYQKTLQRIKELRNEFPQCDFIGININDHQSNKWRNLLSEFQYKTQFEYQFLNDKKSKNELKILTNSDYIEIKGLIIDKTGKFITRATILDPTFSTTIQDYLDLE